MERESPLEVKLKIVNHLSPYYPDGLTIFWLVCTVFSTLLTLVVLLLMTKHFKMKSLIVSLVISTLPPPPEVMVIKQLRTIGVTRNFNYGTYPEISLKS